MLSKKLPLYETHLCVDCAYRTEAFDARDEQDGFIVCLRSKDIAAMSIYEVAGQSNLFIFLQRL